MSDLHDPKMWAEETCFDCDGLGCETCADTGKLYTWEAIQLQDEPLEEGQ